jgi:hypothetical protein
MRVISTGLELKDMSDAASNEEDKEHLKKQIGMLLNSDPKTA